MKPPQRSPRHRQRRVLRDAIRHTTDANAVAAAGWFVLTLNDPFVPPAATTIELVAGVATAAFVLRSVTLVPPAGAAHSSVAWPRPCRRQPTASSATAVR